MVYTITLPKFRKAFIVQGVNQLTSFFIYFPLLFVTNAIPVITLSIIGIVFDIGGRYSLGLVSLHGKREAKKAEASHNTTDCYHSTRRDGRRSCVSGVKWHHWIIMASTLLVSIRTPPDNL
jgi:hypothetical protein